MQLLPGSMNAQITKPLSTLESFMTILQIQADLVGIGSIQYVLIA